MILENDKRREMFDSVNELINYLKYLRVISDCKLIEVEITLINLRNMVQNPIELTEEEIKNWHTNYNNIKELFYNIKEQISEIIADTLI